MTMAAIIRQLARFLLVGVWAQPAFAVSVEAASFSRPESWCEGQHERGSPRNRNPEVAQISVDPGATQYRPPRGHERGLTASAGTRSEHERGSPLDRNPEVAQNNVDPGATRTQYRPPRGHERGLTASAGFVLVQYYISSLRKLGKAARQQTWDEHDLGNLVLSYIGSHRGGQLNWSPKTDEKSRAHAAWDEMMGDRILEVFKKPPEDFSRNGYRSWLLPFDAPVLTDPRFAIAAFDALPLPEELPDHLRAGATPFPWVWLKAHAEFTNFLLLEPTWSRTTLDAGAPASLRIRTGEADEKFHVLFRQWILGKTWNKKPQDVRSFLRELLLDGPYRNRGVPLAEQIDVQNVPRWRLHNAIQEKWLARLLADPEFVRAAIQRGFSKTASSGAAAASSAPVPAPSENSIEAAKGPPRASGREQKVTRKHFKDWKRSAAPTGNWLRIKVHYMSVVVVGKPFPYEPQYPAPWFDCEQMSLDLYAVRYKLLADKKFVADAIRRSLIRRDHLLRLHERVRNAAVVMRNDITDARVRVRDDVEMGNENTDEIEIESVGPIAELADEAESEAVWWFGVDLLWNSLPAWGGIRGVREACSFRGIMCASKTDPHVLDRGAGLEDTDAASGGAFRTRSLLDEHPDLAKLLLLKMIDSSPVWHDFDFVPYILGLDVDVFHRTAKTGPDGSYRLDPALLYKKVDEEKEDCLQKLAASGGGYLEILWAWETWNTVTAAGASLRQTLENYEMPKITPIPNAG